ncbi:MAG TPA: serine/threonine-protein kinase [Polyangia bacterium]|nr:serine/threonine-protein kinase [Polyangia bacterium]
MAEATAAGTGVLPKGAAIGRYVVLGLVGRGGMGEVYAAYDPELDRRIAVKLLRGHAAGADAEGRLRLLREAQAIAKLSHPNVVVVYDVGTFRDSVFIAMEFVEGNTVGYWMQAAARTIKEVLSVFLAAGRGLAAAHAAGMVHRDFKPENVMLTKDGQVRVMDFGLARQLGEEGAAPVATSGGDSGRLGHLLALGEPDEPMPDGPSIDLDATAKLGPGGAVPAPAREANSGRFLNHKLTQTGALVGTPAYMAPEQFAGTTTDARTDQFSFCVALYEALYGQRPFDGDTIVALMANVVAGTVRDVPEGSHVPTRLRKILLRGLEADPSRRHPSMAELLAALETDPSARPRRWLFGIAAAVTCGAAVFVGARQMSTKRIAMCAGAPARLEGAWELGGPSARKREIEAAFTAKGKVGAARLFASVSALLDTYAERWAAMYTDTCEATHVRGEQSVEVLDLRMTCLGQRLTSLRALTDVLARADADVVENAVSAAGALPSLERCADVAMLKTVVQPPADPKVRQRVQDVGAAVARVRALGDSGQCNAASEAGKAAVVAARSTRYLPLIAEASYVAGEAAKFCTPVDDQVELFEDAVWAAEASQDDEIAVGASGSAGGLVADRLHDPKRAHFWIKHAEAILQRLPGHPLLEAYTLVDRGIVDMAAGDYAADLEEQRRALEIKERILGPLHPDSAGSAMNVGVALHELGRDGEAEAYARRAVETYLSLLGPNSARGATAVYDWAETLLGLGRSAEARDAFRRATDAWSHTGGDPFLVAAGQLGAARVDLYEKHPDEARRKIEPVLSVLTRDAVLGGEARVTLADALWVTPRERRRAVELVRAARRDLTAAAAPPSSIAKCDAWLAAHVAR